MNKAITLETDDRVIKAAPKKFFKICYQTTGQIMELARQEAKNRAPGRIGGSQGGYGGISFRVEVNGEIIEGTLAAVFRDPETGVDIAYFVHEGTGLYGPRKQLIRPKYGKALAWVTLKGLPRPQTAQEWKLYRMRGLAVVVKSTKGQKPNPFLLEGMKKALEKAPEIYRQVSKRMNEES
jgi:hypothetical protein